MIYKSELKNKLKVLIKAIKFNASGSENSSNKRGNFGVRNKKKGGGPTAETGFVNGINPPVDGYTIYGPGQNIRVAADDAELIYLAGFLGLPTTSVSDILDAALIDPKIFIVGGISDGATLHLDAGDPSSFDGGTAWTNLNGTSNNINLGVGITAPTWIGTDPDDYPYFNFNGDEGDFVQIEGISYGNENQISEMTTCAWIRTSCDAPHTGSFSSINWGILDFGRDKAFKFMLNDAGRIQMSGSDVTNGYFDIVGETGCGDGQWHLVGWTYSATNKTIRMWVDGVLDQEFTYGSVNALGKGASTTSGVLNRSIHFDGDLSQLYFWDNKVLTDLQMKTLYHSTRSLYKV